MRIINRGRMNPADVINATICCRTLGQVDIVISTIVNVWSYTLNGPHPYDGGILNKRIYLLNVDSLGNTFRGCIGCVLNNQLLVYLLPNDITNRYGT